VEISNDGSVSGSRGTADCDRLARLVITVGDFHTAESFSDSLRQDRQCSRLDCRDRYQGGRGGEVATAPYDDASAEPRVYS